MNKVWVGIDCGKSGGIGAVYSDGRVEAWHTPTVKITTKSPRAKTKKGNPRKSIETFYNLEAMLALLQQFRKLKAAGWEVAVAIEKQQPHPNDAKNVVFQVGRGQGLWEMASAANKLAFTLVRPVDWKKCYVPKGAPKTESIKACLQLYPEAHLPLKKDEAKAEGILIADFIMRKSEDKKYPRKE